jgi:hypothetical protein
MPKYQVSGIGTFERSTFYVPGAAQKAEAVYALMQQEIQKGGYPIQDVRVESQKIGLLGEKRNFLKISSKGEVAQIYASPYGNDLYIMALVLPEKGFKIGPMKLFAGLKERLNPFELQDLEMFSYAIQKMINNILDKL